MKSKILQKLKHCLFLATILFSFTSSAQCDGRYQAEIFTSTTKISDVNYSDVFFDNEHKMDIYLPDGDTATNRPVIIFIHGGSFYAGDKSQTDCEDFCRAFAKRGYVTASVNYRLVSFINIANFLTNHQTQYEAVLKATADVKSAIRYFRKDYSNGNSYGIDPNTIFVGGSSAGGVTAIHLAYIDDIIDLPTTPSNIQNLATNLGGLEGDAGNLGFSSNVNGVISFAGGINTLQWLDAEDEPLFSAQGTADQTVNFNCGPGLGQATVLTLCGTGEMHPQADNVGLLNKKLIFQGEGHGWCSSGNSNPYFAEAIDSTSSFLYPLLPCNNISSTNNITLEKKLISIIDLLGRKTNFKKNTPLIYIYDNGTIEKKIVGEY